MADLEGDNYDQEEKTLKEVVQRLTLRDMMERGEEDEFFIGGLRLACLVDLSHLG